MTYGDRLRKSEWEIRILPLAEAHRLVAEHHYARGGANTATYRHGLFRKGGEEAVGVAWWIPPTKSAALATHPERWTGVLSLSRLVIAPGVPKNAATFLLMRSVRLIDRAKWPVLVTYADEWQGHTGHIYKAAGWQQWGRTKPERCYVKDGRMVARKAGPKTRTHAEMLALGAHMVGSFTKLKFVLGPCKSHRSRYIGTNLKKPEKIIQEIENARPQALAGIDHQRPALRSCRATYVWFGQHRLLPRLRP